MVLKRVAGKGSTRRSWKFHGKGTATMTTRRSGTAEVSADWSDQKKARKDTDARWTKKGGVAFYSDKNLTNMDNKHPLTRKYSSHGHQRARQSGAGQRNGAEVVEWQNLNGEV